MAEVMDVTIRVRALEPAWGSGPTTVVLREVRILAECPKCGGPRGKPVATRQHDDGETYYVSTWENPCGHTDSYAAVAVEAGLTPPR